MVVHITRIAEADIPGAITAIQEAFADDPYNLWVYNDRSKVSQSLDLCIPLSAQGPPKLDLCGVANP
jgi:hypothetical protein